MAVTPGAIPTGTTALILKKGTYVPIEGTVGTLVDTITTTQSDGTVVNRQVLVIGDPEDPAALANVVQLNSGKYAQLVRDPGARGSQGTLEAIYEQNERIIMMLSSIAE